jgi:predicted RNA-binding Zn-ribbon protein involved in translation (DUF1610 family)
MVAELHAPIVYLNHDLCPECGNVSLPRPSRCCVTDLVRVCIECGAAVEYGAIAPPPRGTLDIHE